MENMKKVRSIKVDRDHSLVIQVPNGHPFRVLSYRYRVGEDIVFHFSMLCECNDWAQRLFREAMASLGYEVEQVEIDEYPWLVDRIVLSPVRKDMEEI